VYQGRCTAANIALEPTPNSLRSCLAPALGRGSPRAFGISNSGGGSVNDNFFEISSPRDMLGKAKRELEKMNSDLTTDTVFNFFVTAYHVMDYVKAQEKASKIEIDKMYADSDFEMCNFICNKGKHITDIEQVS
jgi:hypothetical protein